VVGDIRGGRVSELQRDTLFYLNTSLRSGSRPMGALDDSCLRLIRPATETFLFLSAAVADMEGLFRFPAVAIL